ncbi:hypothetical protein COCSUDRAFT_54676 [Coccomyxa subellipsoidea C-169]|uniref:Uncharacterized protein n=1 Tax=Coccomyxa subellipsoidea (strain C-169) TaxID=574566 RepID=I0YLX6_COCSC|nr:hypothetical protein COCSUDRAFT_54676 [Coccomyxa subellipsoidea C-169]EIE19395.1 hypothetical protein COCSUDRAFT_54676 [Coccomyxa subellipsoidea C-169]|eukprot:XP_005643939.1 hypothetical protein COCSUDRAFT_54676 [Coccomyxa subellipsoidea C-169]
MYEVYVGAEQAPAGAPVVTVGSAGQGTADAAATRVAQNGGRAGAVSNRAGVRTEGAESSAPAPAPASRNAGGLPGLADPFPTNGLIWTAG